EKGVMYGGVVCCKEWICLVEGFFGEKVKMKGVGDFLMIERVVKVLILDWFDEDGVWVAFKK
uniref:hypothetical protein n=1 Tax=Bacillus subtilis TaxID=1423 RepID=UPI001BDBAAA1